jgi:hypothetical protein
MNVPSSPSPPPERRPVARTAVDQFWDSFYPVLLLSARCSIKKHDWNGLTRPDAEEIAQGAADRLFSGKTTKHWNHNIGEIEQPESIRAEIARELHRLVELEVDKRRAGRRIENTKQDSLLNSDHYNDLKSSKPHQLVRVVTEDNAAEAYLKRNPSRDLRAAVDYRIMLQELYKRSGDADERKIYLHLLSMEADGSLAWSDLARRLTIPKIFNVRRRVLTQMRKWYDTER